MIILISGATHTGKTLLAQKLLEKYSYPYLSIDHLKMGLIRSKYTKLTPTDDDKLLLYLWPIIREIIKTAIENNQNLIVEGCYIPFDWEKDFNKNYLKEIKYICLIMSKKYIQNNFKDILKFENIVENRLNSKINLEELILENENNLISCKKYNLPYVLFDDSYYNDIEF